MARAAAEIAGVRRVLVLGSQAVLVSLPSEQLPSELLRSMELDVVVLDDLDGRSAQRVAGAIGQDSRFHATHGYFADGMDLDEAVLPIGWEGRTLSLESPTLTTPVTVHAPELHDLCASKLWAGRPKDLAFVGVLHRSGIVDLDDLAARVALLPDDPRRDVAAGRSRPPRRLVRPGRPAIDTAVRSERGARA